MISENTIKMLEEEDRFGNFLYLDEEDESVYSKAAEGWDCVLTYSVEPVDFSDDLDAFFNQHLEDFRLNNLRELIGFLCAEYAELCSELSYCEYCELSSETVCAYYCFIRKGLSQETREQMVWEYLFSDYQGEDWTVIKEVSQPYLITWGEWSEWDYRQHRREEIREELTLVLDNSMADSSVPCKLLTCQAELAAAETILKKRGIDYQKRVIEKSSEIVDNSGHKAQVVQLNSHWVWLENS